MVVQQQRCTVVDNVSNNGVGAHLRSAVPTPAAATTAATTNARRNGIVPKHQTSIQKQRQKQRYSNQQRTAGYGSDSGGGVAPLPPPTENEFDRKSAVIVVEELDASVKGKSASKGKRGRKPATAANPGLSELSRNSSDAFHHFAPMHANGANFNQIAASAAAASATNACCYAAAVVDLNSGGFHALPSPQKSAFTSMTSSATILPPLITSRNNFAESLDSNSSATGGGLIRLPNSALLFDTSDSGIASNGGKDSFGCMELSSFYGDSTINVSTPPSAASTIRYFDEGQAYLTASESDISSTNTVPSFGILNGYDSYKMAAESGSNDFGGIFGSDCSADGITPLTVLEQGSENGAAAAHVHHASASYFGYSNSRLMNHSATNDNCHSGNGASAQIRNGAPPTSDENKFMNSFLETDSSLDDHCSPIRSSNSSAVDRSSCGGVANNNGGGAFHHGGASAYAPHNHHNPHHQYGSNESDTRDMVFDFDYRPAYATISSSSSSSHRQQHSQNDNAAAVGESGSLGSERQPYGEPYSNYYQHYQSPQQQNAPSTSSTSDGYGGLNHHHQQPDSHQQSQLQQQSSGGGNGRARSQTCDSPTISVDDDMPAAATASVDGTGGASASALGHVARTPPETLEWLRNNYEPYEGASLPRCSLYDHYIGHCKASGLEPVNAASFGKLIRSVFKGLRTRRLGTRGNSKYHYNGIRIKESSSLLRLVSDDEYDKIDGAPTQHTNTRNSFRRRSSASYQTIVNNSNNHQNRSTTNTPNHLPAAAAGAPMMYQLRLRNSDNNNSITGNDYSEASMMSAMNESITVAEYVANGDAFDYSNHQQHGEHTMAQPSRVLHGGARSTSLHSNASDHLAEQHHQHGQASDSPVSMSTMENERKMPVGGGAQHRNSNAASAITTTGTTAGSATGGVSDIEMALGNGQVPSVPAPNLDELEECLLPFGYTIAHVLKFMDAYAANCTNILDAIKRLRFETVEVIWTSFWQSSEQVSATDEELSESMAISVDRLLIHRLSALPQIQKYMETMDVAFYQVLVEVLIPDVLRSTLTPRLSCQIRNFAKNVETWLRKAMVNAPPEARKRKAAAVRYLANALTRYTSFNHLADAARAVLRNREQVAQMYNDFCKVDFAIVRAQADWVCDCDTALVSSIESEFKENLKQHRNLDEWTEWMEAVVDQVLAKYHDKPLAVQVNASKQFLLKWSFYSSMILRDVTYRSAQSFGSFHLIRLLYDEYMCLLVEMRLARITNQPTIGVMRPNNNLLGVPMLQTQMSYDLGGGGEPPAMRTTTLGAYYHTVPLHQQMHLQQRSHAAAAATAAMLAQNGGDAMTSTPLSQMSTMFSLDEQQAHTQPQAQNRYDAVTNSQQVIYSNMMSDYQQQQMVGVVDSSAAQNSFLMDTTTVGALNTVAPVTVKYSSISEATVAAAAGYVTAGDSTQQHQQSSASSTFATSSSSVSLVGTLNGGGCPELSEILVQDPTLSSVGYAQQQMDQQQMDQQQQRSTSYGDSASDVSHYMILHPNAQPQSHHLQGMIGDEADAYSAEKSFASSMANATSGMNPYYAAPHHAAAASHRKMGQIVYIEDVEEMLNASPHSQQQQQHHSSAPTRGDEHVTRQDERIHDASAGYETEAVDSRAAGTKFIKATGTKSNRSATDLKSAGGRLKNDMRQSDKSAATGDESSTPPRKKCRKNNE